MSAVERDYDSAENRDEIRQAAEDADKDDGAELSGQEASASELDEAHNDLMNEEQPGADLPGPETKTVEWRGSDLEWNELGHTLVRVAELHENDDIGDGEMLNFIIQTFAEKSVNPAADEEYWKQFDLMRDDDVDGLMDLFERLIGESDGLTEEAQERAERFRN